MVTEWHSLAPRPDSQAQRQQSAPQARDLDVFSHRVTRQPTSKQALIKHGQKIDIEGQAMVVAREGLWVTEGYYTIRLSNVDTSLIEIPWSDLDTFCRPCSGRRCSLRHFRICDGQVLSYCTAVRDENDDLRVCDGRFLLYS